MAFKKFNTVTSIDALLSEFLQAFAATLWLINQKNGVRVSLTRLSEMEGPT